MNFFSGLSLLNPYGEKAQKDGESTIKKINSPEKGKFSRNTKPHCVCILHTCFVLEPFGHLSHNNNQTTNISQSEKGEKQTPVDLSPTPAEIFSPATRRKASRNVSNIYAVEHSDSEDSNFAQKFLWMFFFCNKNCFPRCRSFLKPFLFSLVPNKQQKDCFETLF